MKTANNEDCAADVAAITDFYKDDFNLQQLSLHLNILSTSIPGEKGQHDLSSVLSYLQQLSQPEKELLSEVCTVAALLLVMPATNAASERSFSGLRRLKSYL